MSRDEEKADITPSRRAARVLGNLGDTREKSFGRRVSSRRSPSSSPLLSACFCSSSCLQVAARTMLRSRIASTLARSGVAQWTPRVPVLARSVQTTADSASLIDHGEDSIKVKLHEEYFKAHRCETPGLELEVPKQQLVDIYREMVQ